MYDFSTSGFNLIQRFVQYGASVESSTAGIPGPVSALTKEDGFYITQENGSKILL